MSVVTLTINGQLVSARADDTILLAAREAGIAIPALCYVDGLSAHGGCRMGLVEIAGSPRLQPSGNGVRNLFRPKKASDTRSL